MENLKLSAPWDIYVAEVKELFKKDPEVHVVYDEDGNKVKLLVDNIDKADALSKIMPQTKVFGNVTLTIEVVPANPDNECEIDTYTRAFKGNPVFSEIISLTTPAGLPIHWVVFSSKVAQFYTDDISRPYGITSKLFEDVARDVFEPEEVRFSTETAVE